MDFSFPRRKRPVYIVASERGVFQNGLLPPPPRFCLPLPRPAIHLLKHGRHHAQQRDDEPGNREKERGRLPQRPIAGKTLLKSAAYERHAAGKERKQQQCPGQNV